MPLDKMQKRDYSVVPYDPAWVNKFEELKKKIQTVFGEKALTIEHIGSTSIPGMSAKPVIDVLVTVTKFESFEKEKEHMAKLGYEYGDNYIADETVIFFKTEDGDRKTENIHICVRESYMANRFIRTRNYLRNHPDRAKEYSDLKVTLWKDMPDDYPAYREAKRAFADETERLAREEEGY